MLVLAGGVVGTVLGWLTAAGQRRAVAGAGGDGGGPLAGDRSRCSASLVAGLLAILAAGYPDAAPAAHVAAAPGAAAGVDPAGRAGRGRGRGGRAAAGVVTLLTGDGGADRAARPGAACHRRRPAARAGDHPDRRAAGPRGAASRPAAVGARRPADRPPPGAAPADRHHHRGLRAAGLRGGRLERRRAQPRSPGPRSRPAHRSCSPSTPTARWRCARRARHRPEGPVRDTGRHGVVGHRGRPAHHRGRAGGVRPHRPLGRRRRRPEAGHLAPLTPPPVAPVRLTRRPGRGRREVHGPRDPEVRGRSGARPRTDPAGRWGSRPRTGWSTQVAGRDPSGAAHLPGRGRVHAGLPLAQVAAARTFGDFVDANVQARRARPGCRDRDRPHAGRPRHHDLATRGSRCRCRGRRVRRRLRGHRPRPRVRRPLVTGRRSPRSAATGRSSRHAHHRRQPAQAAVHDRRSPGGSVVGPGPRGGHVASRCVGTVPQIPRAGTRGVLVDLAECRHRPGRRAPAQTSYDVWLAGDDPAARSAPCAASSPTTACASRPATRPAPTRPRSRARARRWRCGCRCWPGWCRWCSPAPVLGGRRRHLGRQPGPRPRRAASGRRPRPTVRAGVGARAPRRRRARRARRRRARAWSPRRRRCRTSRCSPLANKALPLVLSPAWTAVAHHPSAACCCSAPCRSWSAGRSPPPPSRPGCGRADEHPRAGLRAPRCGSRWPGSGSGAAPR